VKPGSGREDADTLYLNSSKETIAHEFTHRILAAPDEYEDEESKREAPNRNLAYEGMENNQLERPYISLMKNSQSGMLLPRHALAIAGMLRHAVDSGGEQTRFSVAFSLDGENERESKRVRNFTANLSNPPSKEGAEFNQLDQRSFARFKSLSEKFEKVGWKFIPGEPIAFRFKNLICSYISKRDVIEEMGRAYDFFPRHPDDNFIHLLVERIGYERFREIVLPGEDQDIPDEKGGFEKKVIANITSAIIGTIAKNADASGEMIDVLNRQFGEILGILEKLGRAERELNEFLTNGPRDVS
jgi:hypothetical protein